MGFNSGLKGLMFEGIYYSCMIVSVVGVIVRAQKFPGNYSVKNNATSSFPHIV
jgi:hypothetical protein